VSEPSLAGENLYTAATVGDVDAVKQILKQRAVARETTRRTEQLGAAALRTGVLAAEQRGVRAFYARSGAGASAIGVDPNAGFLWDGRV
jgi:hypothetical protein